ncbi:hypothetical protein, partial [Frankia sp. AgKG'84/4]|uniref:hypothetical protein n=1 Tax=Frankia sp. AgKG'84/4 TaxID=573490 RepID=UPI00202A6FBC
MAGELAGVRQVVDPRRLELQRRVASIDPGQTTFAVTDAPGEVGGQAAASRAAATAAPSPRATPVTSATGQARPVCRS